MVRATFNNRCQARIDNPRWISVPSNHIASSLSSLQNWRISGLSSQAFSLFCRLNWRSLAAITRCLTVLSKGPVTEGSTFYAQGGIAAVFDETDSIDSHVEDTLIAGAGICDRHAVEFVASNARSCVQWLIDQGVLFDTHVQPNGEESYHLTREGGHSHRRILHAADATGREVQSTLVSKAQNHPNIRVLERSNAVDLIVSDKIGLPGTRRVVGAWVWNRNKETVETCHAKAVVLATGGASKVYQYTTNPDISSGDGIAMAWRAGCMR